MKIFADGKESYFSRESIEVQNNGQLIGQVIVLRNITPFHELDKAKPHFIATISHQLKTPISSIKMSAGLLNDQRVGTLNKEQEELIRSIYEDADRLLGITAELLYLSQVESGNIQMNLQAAEAPSIVGQDMEAVSFQAQQNGICLKLQVPGYLPEILADPEKTTWVLINFLTNAIRYSPEEAEVEIAVEIQEGFLYFSVRDQGSGIEDQYLSRIFDRYFQVPGDFQCSGTGLGLAISKEFIEAQGGSIQAKSRLGEGSIFGFLLPLRIKEAG